MFFLLKIQISFKKTIFSNLPKIYNFERFFLIIKEIFSLYVYIICTWIPEKLVNFWVISYPWRTDQLILSIIFEGIMPLRLTYDYKQIPVHMNPHS